MSHRPTIWQRLATSMVCALGAGLCATAATAADWPVRPVSIVVPFPAGGTTDMLARSLAEQLSQRIGQTVIVENKPGAGATIGADYVAKAKPDGYTLLMGAVHHTIATSVYPSLSYDFQKDLTPVSPVAMVPNVLVINADRTPANSVAELVALAKQSSRELSYGSNGYGTAQHLIGTQFQTRTGTTLLHVPYKGSGPLTTDLLGGQIDMSFDTLATVLPHIRSGKLRALAMTTATRATALPDVPTLAEAGLDGFDIGTWFGVLAPANTPAAIVERLSRDITAIVTRDDFGQRMITAGADPMSSTPQAYAQRIDAETKRFAQLVKQHGITVN